MDYHLERKIRLSEGSEYKSLYSWSLQEFNDEGETIGNDQVPWKWSLFFTASELRYYHSIVIGKSKESDDENNKVPVEERERISAILHSGRCDDGEYLEYDTSYSMFGADRRIKKFSLEILRLNEGKEKEQCYALGWVSFTADTDFQVETMDDTVIITLVLAQNRFNKLIELIQAQRADSVLVSLERVSGFYSEWSPDVSTNKIKILTQSNKQKIILPENCKIDPPRLGDVGEFEITIIQRNKINPKQNLGGIDIDKLFEEPENEEEVLEQLENWTSQPETNSLLIAQLARNQAILAKLRTPIWLIFITLLLLLIKVAF